jgi:hypothetical protein
MRGKNELLSGLMKLDGFEMRGDFVRRPIGPDRNQLAPHIHRMLIDDNCGKPYSLVQAFFQTNDIEEDKYWPPIERLDIAFGGMHLFCSCPWIESFEEDD